MKVWERCAELEVWKTHQKLADEVLQVLHKVEKQTGRPCESHPCYYPFLPPVQVYAPTLDKGGRVFTRLTLNGELVYHGEYESWKTYYPVTTPQWLKKWDRLPRKVQKAIHQWLRELLKEVE